MLAHAAFQESMSKSSTSKTMFLKLRQRSSFSLLHFTSSHLLVTYNQTISGLILFFQVVMPLLLTYHVTTSTKTKILGKLTSHKAPPLPLPCSYSTVWEALQPHTKRAGQSPLHAVVCMYRLHHEQGFIWGGQGKLPPPKEKL